MQNAILVIGLIAASLLMVGYFPQSYQTIKTRNTVGINPYMFGIVWLACVCFFIYGLLFIINGAIIGTDESLKAGAIAGTPIMISNLFVGAMVSIVFIIKFKNMTGAKKMKISEQEYCDQVAKTLSK